MPVQHSIPVTIHKEHILSLGEKMYIESIEFIRELVANAYDADATETHIRVTKNELEVSDNGSGMNVRDLEQYFNIGSPEKRAASLSPRFGRKRIGQFGIGKLSALAIGERFMVDSRKGRWSYSVTFDKQEWQKSNHWQLPVVQEEASPFQKEGTRIVLSRLKKQISEHDIEKYLRQVLPLRAKKFQVSINGHPITARSVVGRIFPIRHKTLYGDIEGEITVATDKKMVERSGLEIRVRHVLVKTSWFGLDTHQAGAARITGWVNADFLPLIASRTDLIMDAPEYRLFAQLMEMELEKVLNILKKETSKKDLHKMSRELKDVLGKIRTALKDHPEFLPSGKTVARRKKMTGTQKLQESVTVKTDGSNDRQTERKRTDTAKKESSPKNKKEEPQKPPETTVLKRMRLPKFGITCAFAHLGENGPPSSSDGNLVYINEDHPLYQIFFKKNDLFELYLSDLITKEIILMRKWRADTSEAFTWQTMLLTSALADVKKKVRERENFPE